MYSAEVQNDDAQEREIQLTVEQCKEEVALRDAVRRLSKNEDFKLIYSEHFLRRFATDQLLARNSPEVLGNPTAALKNQRNIDGFGVFNEFMHMLVVFGNTAEETLKGYYANQGSDEGEWEEEVTE